MAERKGLKLRRQAKGKSYYALQFSRTEKNQKRRMRTHLRANPTDAAALAVYTKKYGAPSIELNARGKKLNYIAHYGRKNWRWHRGAPSPAPEPLVAAS